RRTDVAHEAMVFFREALDEHRLARREIEQRARMTVAGPAGLEYEEITLHQSGQLEQRDDTVEGPRVLEEDDAFLIRRGTLQDDQIAKEIVRARTDERVDRRHGSGRARGVEGRDERIDSTGPELRRPLEDARAG